MVPMKNALCHGPLGGHCWTRTLGRDTQLALVCRYQVFPEVVRKLTEKSRPSSVLQHSTHRVPGQNPMVGMSTSPAPARRKFLGPVTLPGSVSLTSIATALSPCQGTRAVGWFLAYLCSWKMIRLCIEYISALLSWLTSFLPTEKKTR